MDFVGECYIIQRPYLHSEVIGYNTFYKKSHNQRTASYREITGGGRVYPEGHFAPVSPTTFHCTVYSLYLVQFSFLSASVSIASINELLANALWLFMLTLAERKLN